MAGVSVLVLRAAGTNCDGETCHAWERAGAAPQRVHIRELAESPHKLAEYAILTLPGGFSYGDDIGAGRILASQLARHLGDAIREFVRRDRLVLGICNGFQALAKAGLLSGDGSGAAPADVTLCDNEPPGFQDRWVTLRAAERTRCAFLEPGRAYELPIAHGEGRVRFANEAAERAAIAEGRAALLYCRPAAGAAADVEAVEGPFNPNGSTSDIAGLCDSTGRIFGLMPHPERFVIGTQHPCWTSRPAREDGDGLAIFEQAVRRFR
ncbi:MAG: phosphoribosylformylglycinamidine synthase subunit PurQ [Phycisphaerales bacterium]|nr:phosphoribosylformylglycinamidine synthase subunit PurQ [Phycisphaerales bacterium]